MIYRQYFFLRDGFSIHIHERESPARAGVGYAEARVSSRHHDRLDADDFEDLCADLETSRISHTALLHASSAVHAEAAPHTDEMNRFRILGNYDSSLEIERWQSGVGGLSQSVLSKIKRLELHWLEFCLDNVFDRHPSSHTHFTENDLWAVILHRMINLEYLTFVGSDGNDIALLLETISRSVTIFADRRTKIRVVLCLNARRNLPFPPKVPNTLGEQAATSPRLIVPPLKEMLVQGDSISDTEHESLRATDFRKYRLRHCPVNDWTPPRYLDGWTLDLKRICGYEFTQSA